MKRHFIWAIIAAGTMLVSCSGKKDGVENADGGANPPANSSTSLATAPSSTASASLAAADREAEWRASWRRKHLAAWQPQHGGAAFVRAAEKILSTPGADPSDTASRAKSLGSDPQKTFEFLRDQIGVEPYDGVLRGARGTLMAGAGNALDRALLARDLLEAQGQTTRLVSGQLPEEQAHNLLDRFLRADSPPALQQSSQSTASDSSLNQEAADIAAKTGLSLEAVAEFLMHARQREQAFRTQIAANALTQSNVLKSHLLQDRRRAPVDVAALHSTLIGRLQTHYWVQVRSRDGEWTDFDPILPDAALGARYGMNPEVLKDIPADAYHELQFSLVYVAAREGAKVEDVLLTGRVRSSEALFQPVSFSIQPNGGSAAFGQLGAKMPGERVQYLKALQRFQAVLLAGSETAVSKSFDLAGNVFDRPDSPLPLAPATSLMDALGGDSQTPPQFLELRVVLRLTGPGRDQETQIRTLVRGQDTEAPDFAPPLMSWELLLQPQWVSDSWLGVNMLRQAAAAMRQASESAGSETLVALPDYEEVASTRLLQFAMARQTSLAEALKASSGITAMIDTPLLTIYGYRISGARQQPEEVRAEHFIDLVDNALQVVPADQASAAKAYELALSHSGADSALESATIELLQPGSNPDSGAVVFDAAQSQGKPPFLANSRDVDLLRSSGVSESDIEWIYDYESTTSRLLVAVAPDGSTAWWSVQPDGIAVLRMNGGRGGAMTEAAINNTKAVMMGICGLTSITMAVCGVHGAGSAILMCLMSGSVSLAAMVSHPGHWYSAIMIAAEALETVNQGVHFAGPENRCRRGS
jgi:uncharacterized membrane protein